MAIPNILAERYASPEMTAIFEPENKVRLERRLWLAVLRAQADLGVPVPPGAIDAYQATVDEIDLDSIRRRDEVLKHDVKARIDEFNALAGHEQIHKGLTSRDVTENVEQLQVRQAIDLVESRTVALLARFADRAAEHAALAMVGRTHNVPAQPVTLGKRFAQAGEELLAAHRELTTLRDDLALRGIKGPVGSQQDQLQLLGSAERVAELEARIADHLGFGSTLAAVGQVYPRSWDLAVVSSLTRLASGPSNLALTVRLMAGHDLVTEGFRAGQVGSSAMPHKMNTRSCERINGLRVILNGYLTMAAGLAGDQWNEGDVSCSVVRRVVLPDAFFALDGLYETTFAVLRDFGAFPAVIRTEVNRYLPFLATTALLMHAVTHGVGREAAHEVIKEHATAVALDMRQGSVDGRDLVLRLGADDRFPGGPDQLGPVVEQVVDHVGTIDKQIATFCADVRKAVEGRSEAGYQGTDIL